MHGCSVEKIWVSKSRPGLTNHTMASLVWEALQAVGPPHWDEAALDVARQVQAACGITPMTTPLIPDCTALIAPQDAEAELRRTLPPDQLNATSDDYTDMSWHAPLARFYIARPALRGGPYPAWAMNALGGIPATIDPMVQVAARVLARSALRILTDAEIRSEAWAEFERRRADGPAPLCDYPPPLGLAWPEYVETARGRHWHLPG